MLRSGLFSVLAVLTALPLGMAQQVQCENGRCVKVIYGSAPASPHLRVSAHGPVTLEGGTSPNLSYEVRVTVDASSAAEGRRVLQQYNVRLTVQGGWTVLSAPGGPVMSTVTVKAPRLTAAAVKTSDGAVEARGIDGPLEVDSGAGPMQIDRVLGDTRLSSGGGDIRIGDIGGTLRCTTGAGLIYVRSVKGEATLQTIGGDIVANTAGGSIHAETGGGGVHIGTAAGAVTAISGGGEIIVEKAGGVVTLRNMAGPVQVGSARGVRCESGSGGVRLTNITGPMRVSTSMGSIVASLLGSHLAESFLATGNGDITVLIPSNVGVTIQAQNTLADTLRRITSDFSGIQARRQGTKIVAEGSINGGGPLLQISGTGGTIFIKKQ